MNYRIVEKESFKIVGFINKIDEDTPSLRSEAMIGIELPDDEISDDFKKFLRPSDNDGIKFIDIFANSVNKCRAHIIF